LRRAGMGIKRNGDYKVLNSNETVDKRDDQKAIADQKPEVVSFGGQ
jgi:hypothetical protein